MILPILIVKNEEDNIKNTLMPFIEKNIKEFFILDTGSTDNTVDIIKNIYKEFNLNGTIIQEKFIDFSTTRNRAIELAKNIYKTPFYLFLDAEWYIKNFDELLIFCHNEIYTNNEYYYITIKTPQLTYLDIRLFKYSGNKKFKGVVHELMDSNTQCIVPDNIYFQWSPSKKSMDVSSKRWEEDIKKLLLVKNKTSRDIFFIAETYYHLKSYKLAEYSYKERISMKGKIEEIYFCYYRLGEITKNINYLLKSYHILKIRAEPLIQIALILEDEYTKYSFLKLSLKIQEPKSLFVNSYMYKLRYKLFVESCYKLELYKEAEPYLKYCDKIPFVIPEKECIQKKELNYITIAILIHNKEIFLPTYLKSIESQTYPKNKILLYIRTNNNTDNSKNIITEWLKKQNYYKIYFNDMDILDLKKHKEHEWNAERFNILGKIRQESVLWALENNSDYFTIDCDNFMHKNTILDLYESNCDIVSAFMIANKSNKYSNFHAHVNDKGYCEKGLLYEMIYDRVLEGIIQVPVVHCNYLIKKEYLNKIKYIDDTQRHEYVIFSDNCRKNNIPQHINNKKIYGFISFSTTKKELENEPWYGEIGGLF